MFWKAMQRKCCYKLQVKFDRFSDKVYMKFYFISSVLWLNMVSINNNSSRPGSIKQSIITGIEKCPLNSRAEKYYSFVTIESSKAFPRHSPGRRKDPEESQARPPSRDIHISQRVYNILTATAPWFIRIFAVSGWGNPAAAVTAASQAAQCANYEYQVFAVRPIN